MDNYKIAMERERITYIWQGSNWVEVKDGEPQPMPMHKSQPPLYGRHPPPPMNSQMTFHHPAEVTLRQPVPFASRPPRVQQPPQSYSPPHHPLPLGLQPPHLYSTQQHSFRPHMHLALPAPPQQSQSPPPYSLQHNFQPHMRLALPAPPQQSQSPPPYSLQHNFQPHMPLALPAPPQQSQSPPPYSTHHIQPHMRSALPPPPPHSQPLPSTSQRYLSATPEQQCRRASARIAARKASGMLLSDYNMVLQGQQGRVNPNRPHPNYRNKTSIVKVHTQGSSEQSNETGVRDVMHNWDQEDHQAVGVFERAAGGVRSDDPAAQSYQKNTPAMKMHYTASSQQQMQRGEEDQMNEWGQEEHQAAGVCMRAAAGFRPDDHADQPYQRNTHAMRVHNFTSSQQQDQRGEQEKMNQWDQEDHQAAGVFERAASGLRSNDPAAQSYQKKTPAMKMHYTASSQQQVQRGEEDQMNEWGQEEHQAAGVCMRAAAGFRPDDHADQPYQRNTHAMRVHNFTSSQQQDQRGEQEKLNQWDQEDHQAAGVFERAASGFRSDDSAARPCSSRSAAGIIFNPDVSEVPTSTVAVLTVPAASAAQKENFKSKDTKENQKDLDLIENLFADDENDNEPTVNKKGTVKKADTKPKLGGRRNTNTKKKQGDADQDEDDPTPPKTVKRKTLRLNNKRSVESPEEAERTEEPALKKPVFSSPIEISDDDSLPDIDLTSQTMRENEVASDSSELGEDEDFCAVGHEKLRCYNEVLKCYPCKCASACVPHAVDWISKHKTCYQCGEKLQSSDAVTFMFRKFL